MWKNVCGCPSTLCGAGRHRLLQSFINFWPIFSCVFIRKLCAGVIHAIVFHITLRDLQGLFNVAFLMTKPTIHGGAPKPSSFSRLASQAQQWQLCWKRCLAVICCNHCVHWTGMPILNAISSNQCHHECWPWLWQDFFYLGHTCHCWWQSFPCRHNQSLPFLLDLSLHTHTHTHTHKRSHGTWNKIKHNVYRLKSAAVGTYMCFVSCECLSTV